MTCDKDCFHCTYEDCICDELDYADYQALAQMEAEYIHPKTAKQKQVAAQQKAWREANREKEAARKKAWREANREKEAARKKAWYEANQADPVNRAAGDALRRCRKERGLTQRALASLCGATQCSVSLMESGRIPVNPAVRCALPGLEVLV